MLGKYGKYCDEVSGNRALPDLIIIGAQKSGTTSLYSYLSQHPDLFPSSVKEVHFFDGGLDPDIDNFEKGETWYKEHFPLKKNIRPHQKTFEASPLYIFNPLVPERIFNLIPKVKIIALLRNPTERAISHYFHVKRKNLEPLPLFEALKKENYRLEYIIKNKDYKNIFFRIYSYKSRGLYKKQIERYLRYFSKSQILILNSEKFFIEPKIALQRIYKFVGVDTKFSPSDLKPLNVTYSTEKIDSGVYEYLNTYFQAHNNALYDLIGKSYNW